MLLNSSNAVAASYLYDAFGNVLSAAGSLADANLYQFSSKERHLNSGLVYYLYRFYDPNLQRWPNRDSMGEPGFETLHLVSQPLFIRKLRFAINDSELQFILAMAIQNGSISVADYLRNSHISYKGNRISALAFFNMLRNGQSAYAPNWPAELLEYPNLYKYVGSDPINGIDSDGLSWYNPWSWGIWNTAAEAIWDAVQYIAPAGEGEGAGAAACAGDLYKIETNQPPKIHFGNDPVNNPVPPTAG